MAQSFFLYRTEKVVKLLSVLLSVKKREMLVVGALIE